MGRPPIRDKLGVTQNYRIWQLRPFAQRLKHSSARWDLLLGMQGRLAFRWRGVPRQLGDRPQGGACADRFLCTACKSCLCAAQAQR